MRWRFGEVPAFSATRRVSGPIAPAPGPTWEPGPGQTYAKCAIPLDVRGEEGSLVEAASPG